jgi:hypothetical protein
MNKKMMTATIVVGAVLSGTVLAGSGLAVGYNLAGQERAAEQADASQPIECNLGLVWDRVGQDFQAVYEDSTFVSQTPVWGRTANLSCTDAEILDWQEQRRADGLEDQVCRPMLINGVDSVYVDGCTAPVVVVERERR